jgi:hypothetical protein
VSAELRITPVLTGPGQMMLMVSGPHMAVQKGLPRPLPAFDDQVLESFRRGTISDAKLQELSDDVTDWLFGADLRAVLVAALPLNAGGLRVVVEVPDEMRPILWQIPLELVWHDTPQSPLLLRNDVQSLAYVVAKSRPAGSVPPPHNWPFKILIVRAYPPDLDEVPDVAPLAATILATGGAEYGDGMVQVDVLSREAGVGKPATWQAFRRQLQDQNDYDLLVFLGHGELAPSAAGGEPTAQLFFESEDGNGSHPIDAPQLARLLAECPVDIVILAGCLTGVEPPGAVVRRRGGAQGVAQTLVNSSESGVEVAVAMRTELQTKAAVDFLEDFFKSLLNPRPNPKGVVSGGHIDRSVRKARRELYLDAIFPPQWAAPVVLRANQQEPYIPYLAQPVKFTVNGDMNKQLEVRATLWKFVADYSHAQGVPAHMQAIMDSLTATDESLKIAAEQMGPIIMPRRMTIPAGQADTLVFELRGPLSIVSMSARVVVPDGMSVQGLTLAVPAQARFELIPDANDPVAFELRSRTGVAQQLPAGAILRATLDVGAAVPSGVYALSVDIQRLKPQSVLWPGQDIVIVPRP